MNKKSEVIEDNTKEKRMKYDAKKYVIAKILVGKYNSKCIKCLTYTPSNAVITECDKKCCFRKNNYKGE